MKINNWIEDTSNGELLYVKRTKFGHFLLRILKTTFTLSLELLVQDIWHRGRSVGMSILPHTHTHTHTHTHAHAHACTHTHTHTLRGVLTLWAQWISVAG